MNRTFVIEGYAAIFDVADGLGDIIRHGAFTETLAGRRDPLPVLWEHRPEQRLGNIIHVEQNMTGLWIVAEIEKPVRPVQGLSFGYYAKDFVLSMTERTLKRIELVEISVTAWPLHPLATFSERKIAA